MFIKINWCARAIKHFLFDKVSENKRRNGETAGQYGKMAVAARLCRVRFLIKNDFTRVLKYSTLVNSVSLNSVSKKKFSFIYHMFQLFFLLLYLMKNNSLVCEIGRGGGEKAKGLVVKPTLQLCCTCKHSIFLKLFLVIKRKCEVRCVGLLFISNYYKVNNHFKNKISPRFFFNLKQNNCFTTNIN